MNHVMLIMPVSPSHVHIGDRIRLSDDVIVVVTGVTHINKHPIQLYRLAFNPVGGVDSITLPATTLVAQVYVAPPSPRRWHVTGTVYTKTRFERTIQAPNASAAHIVAEGLMTENLPSGHEMHDWEIASIEEAIL